MQSISIEDLNLEFTNWVKQNGNSRNNQDLRFSQHIHNSYDLTNLNLKDDGFYIENAEKFYLCIMKSLLCKKEIVKTNKLKLEA
tara:strand:- start:120 stop:371 length:252 start_codon:yes stop_codon:yes gene_type:complete